MDNVYKLAVSNGKLFLGIDDSKTKTFGDWVSDGTATGSKPLKELTARSGYVECNGLSYFVIIGAEYYAELWATDGTTVGTALVKNLKPAWLRDINMLLALNNKLYFIGKDDEHGRELWVSDGTESGTKLFKDINPGVENSVPMLEGGLNFSTIVYKNKLYFSASNNAQNNIELWVSDGTETGTKLFKEINSSGASHPAGFKIVGDKMYFSAITVNEGAELWVSDGTEAGTHLVKDIAPQEEFSSPGGIVEYNGKAYFTMLGDKQPRQLWSTDGTEAGTTLLEDNVGNSTAVFNGEFYYSKIVGGT